VLGEDVGEAHFGTGPGAEPSNYAAAMKSPDAAHWHKAMEEEYLMHLQNRTWEIVKLPPGKKAIGSGWVYRVKRNADGSIERYKGRLVAKGFSQRPGLDYTEVFAPTARQASIRLILALAALEDLHLHSIDISHAFINGKLEEEVYMEQPQGFQEHGPEYVCKLGRAIYGLHQAGRVWNKDLHGTLTSLGFKRLDSDRSIYLYARNDLRIIMPVVVDDMTLASKSQQAIDDFIKELSQHYDLRDLGPTTLFLGIEIQRDRANHSISLCQHQYILNMLERFKLTDCNSVQTPMDPGQRLDKSMGPSTPDDVAFMRQTPYLSAVGALMYLAVTTRPDIMNAVSILSRFNTNPGPAHWKAVKVPCR
jgi:Reverse transcriptase (RNA-dependent DNA polymerase)